jgi:hypothetical protein
VTDEICFDLPDDIVITGQLMVTDSCNNTAMSTLTLTAIVNTTPVVTIDAPPDVFVCDVGDTVCVDMTITDPDNGLTAQSQFGWVDLSDSTVCFTVDTSGYYCNMVTITDSCGSSDVQGYCINIEVNTPPVCSSSDEYHFVCDDTTFNIPFMAYDADGNLESCTKTSGPGSYAGGIWTFTTNGTGVYAATFECVDSCGAVCEGEAVITVTVNSGPIAECPANETIVINSLAEICIPGFSCFDADDNLAGCSVSVNGVMQELIGDEVCFLPEWGENTIILYAVDECEKTDDCTTIIFVTWQCPVITIEKSHETLQGHFVDISITIEDNPVAMGGFDFLIAYDASALTFTEATPGQLLEDCGWEYFTYRYGVFGNCGDACPSGLLRIIALAETNNGPNHPSCYGPPDTDPHELAELRFFVTNDRTFECQYVPIYFFWMSCNDNAISSVTGDTLTLASQIYDFEGNLIWDEDDDDLFPEDERIPFVGAPDYCLEGDKISPIRCLEFVYGGVDIVCSDSIDARGDLNANGVANEVADAVMFTNYFLSGLSAFGNHVEASIAASDINADGIALSVADLVYLVRVITGDAPPYPKPLPNESFVVTASMSDNLVSVNYESEIEAGAILLTFLIEGSVGAPTLGDGASGMDIKYDIQGNEMKTLVYNIGTGSIASGSHQLLTIPVEGSLTLVEADAASYFGNVLNVTTRVLPSEFKLTQNQPNPFNPTTTISLTMPVASDWTITVFNISGQVVSQFSGYDDAGTVQVTWDGTNTEGRQVASGIYLYRATAGQFSETRKMVLMK